MSGLSLFTIDDSLRGLVEAFEDIAAQLPDAERNERLPEAEQLAMKRPAELLAELGEVERLLIEYATAYVGKVDSMYYYLRKSEVELKAAKAEAALCEARAKRIETSRERVKSILLQVMTAAGKDRIDGTAGKYIARQSNGGLAPLAVDGWDGEKWTRPLEDVPLPSSMMLVKVYMPLALLDRLRELIPEVNAVVRARAIEPDNGVIRAALAEDCERCKGGGEIAASVDGKKSMKMCPDCGGGKKRVVPGARLKERGQQLRLR